MFVANAVVIQKLPQSCLVDITPPTFGGITSLIANPNGSVKPSWSAATETGTPPVRYNVYIKKDNATSLFTSANLLLSTPLLTLDLYQTPDGLPLQEQATYFVGVRAVDGVGNESSNTQSLSVISSGVFSQSLANLADAVRALIRASEVHLVGDLVQPEVLSGELVDT